jgi:FAD/FMN-containing dehydrogenase
MDPSDARALLTGRLRGPVTTPGDHEYDAERASYQLARQHRPAVIVGATTAEDVCAAVDFAAARGLPVAVQAHGHGLSSAADGGVLVNTRRMTAMSVDPAARRARLEAGVRWQEVVEAAAPHGLAPISGSAPDVGAVPYTLGGGLGLLARRHGYASDHVSSMDVVTAGAELRHVAPDIEPDLFWALRGGRDNFGVVTGMEVELVPVARIFGGGMHFDGALARVILETYREWTATVPEELTSSVALLPFPDVPAVPEPLRGRYVVHVRIAATVDAATGDGLVAPLRAIGPRVIDTVGEMPYAASRAIYNDPTFPSAYVGTSAMLRELAPPALEAALAVAGPEAPVHSIVELRHLGGALARPPAVPSAVGHREASHLLRVFSPLEAASDAALDAARDVHRGVFAALAPWTAGRFLNFQYDVATPDQVREAYDGDVYRRLTELKAVYDPANMFRFNLNIPPAAR